MSTVYDLKGQECPGTPLFLLDCTLASGDVQRLSTHAVTWNGQSYAARILDHNLFELQNSTTDVIGAAENLRVLLADADAVMSEVDRNVGWKGSRVLVTLLFFDLVGGVATSEGIVVFSGLCNPVDETTEDTLQLSFINRLNLQRSYVPTIRIQRLCPWAFPATPAQRTEAVNGGSAQTYSRFYSCGYSADVAGGSGTLNGTAAFSACDYSRSSCQQRGMFSKDAGGQNTSRFGGIEFMPPAIQVRSYGERGTHTSPLIDNAAVYNDVVPLVYGTGWFQPPVVFSRNDGNLTRMQVLLGSGEIDRVVKVVVNNVEIPAGQAGANMTATGWYNLASRGTRTGAFDADFCDSNGNPLGDPYGSMAYLSVVVPNGIGSGVSLPGLDVLVRGMKLPQYDNSGAIAATSYTNNPAWILLDVLMRAGWNSKELNLPSFVAAAQFCGQLITGADNLGNPTQIPRYQCNLLITKRRSVGDLVRGICNGSGILLRLDDKGLLEAVVLNTVALQQDAPAPGSNSSESLDGGWPAYEFGDGGFSGIVRQSDGSSSLKISSQPITECPNRYTVEFQDEFNEFQQDSLSLSDVDDIGLINQEVTATLQALGLPGFNQASRLLARQLNLAVNGNTYVQFETSVRGAGLKPGDIIALTCTREGWSREPFRITSISPRLNFRTAVISAQIHDDSWYGDTAYVGSPAGRRQSDSGTGLPRPLLGTVVNADGSTSFGISEQQQELSDGTVDTILTVQYVVPPRPSASAADIPLVSLSVLVNTSGGTLAGASVYYYAISALDACGAESPLSFTVQADVPPGGNSNAVVLQNLSFSAAASSFNVYRGTTADAVERIASAQALAASFTDDGLKSTSVPPPDQNFDHANFYWRLQIQPDTPATSFSSTSVGNATLEMPAGQYAGLVVRISAGTGARQERVISGNTGQSITTSTPWDVTPDATSVFAIVQPGWRFAGTTTTGTLQFQAPTQPGGTIEVCGRSANVLNQECSQDSSPITEWQLGMSGSVLDTDAPPAPIYGIGSTGRGGVAVSGLGFQSLVNTTTITSCTLELFYWNELNEAATTSLGSALDATSTSCATLSAAAFHIHDVLQIDQEIFQVTADPGSDGTLQVSRAILGSSSAPHTTAAAVYRLDSHTYVLSFPERFFGSSASGSYVYNIDLPCARIAAAQCFATNYLGSGPVQDNSYTNATNNGLRTLSGGQLCFQVAGSAAVQNDAAPKITVDRLRSIGSVFATVNTAPSGGDLLIAVTRNESELCRVTVPDGTTSSATVDGFGLGVLQPGDALGINILSAPAGATAIPGQGLTVTILL